ncbi:C4b-binding protein beta chain isoform X2 [Emydura macquarii macquarii]|uniref:C4b-binding protein beta chain isoform X2 n=1 Tax=Emydura macquarii macquarii TaxID=1129001 RepID=UPI00352A5099
MKIWLMYFILATWLPTLWAGSCGDIPKVDNSIAYSQGADEGKRVTYVCSDGYRLFGENTLYCTSSQEWHPPAPFCKAWSPGLSEPNREDEEREESVTEKRTQTVSADVDVRKLRESLSCGMNAIETKSMMEVEKLRLEKLKFQQEGRQGN